MKKIYTLLLLLFMTTGFAQEMYIVNNFNEIKIIDLNDFSVTNLFTIPTSEAGFITDLAFAPDGKLYGVTNVWTIIEIDLVSETFIPVTTLPEGDSYTSLVCNANNELLTSRWLAQELYSHNLDTGVTEFVDNDISSPGDYTFYKGNMVYPGFLNDFIKAYDGSEIVNIGCSVPLLWTFVNDFVDCDTNTIYAMDQFAKLYRYDLETEDYELLADLVSLTGQVYGGATMTEYMASACPVQSLNTVVCSLNTEDFDPYGIELIENPVRSTLRFQIVNPANLSYSIYNLEGKLIRAGKLQNQSIPISEIPTGVYFLQLEDRNGMTAFSERIIKE
ncbi:T9SS type A sorting domain-containing protein [Aureisphaera galaxeae]|uniref:T9SS type A sorting domain-containing protein n=1 Tax=Aureisphaera galaxeae TaxID=1538023 RepID=UPI00234FBF96|nr:T9SS type A sorting domain-containing protein [Aureisphaera galaxeae]MDC8005981.1 T9SS type A sorting domain-containing protein [Aureisphaera galaxeae]